MKAEEFIGWKSQDGLLTVIGISSYQGSAAVYNVHCEICSKDIELFPNGLSSIKSSLIKGNKPCGCAKFPKWNANQHLIIANRKSNSDLIIHGYAEQFHGKNTLISRSCINFGHTHSVKLHQSNTPCKICYSNRSSLGIVEATKRASEVCEFFGYLPIGFMDGYKNSYSIFTYKCHKHDIRRVRYTNLLQNNKCHECKKEEDGFYGYYKDRIHNSDYLYVLNFDNQFIKVGRTFDINQRIRSLKHSSGIDNIFIVNLINGTHEYIYSLEQALLQFLRTYHLSYEVSFTTEAFSNESIDYISYFIKDKQHA